MTCLRCDAPATHLIVRDTYTGKEQAMLPSEAPRVKRGEILPAHGGAQLSYKQVEDTPYFCATCAVDRLAERFGLRSAKGAI